MTTLTNPAQTARDLRRAAETSARHGWTQGSFRGTNDTLCAVGAMRTALTGYVYTQLDDAHERRLYDMCGALMPLLPGHFQPERRTTYRSDMFDQLVVNGVVQFNDSSSCTGGDEIRLLFTQAAEKLEAEL